MSRHVTSRHVTSRDTQFIWEHENRTPIGTEYLSWGNFVNFKICFFLDINSKKSNLGLKVKQKFTKFIEVWVLHRGLSLIIFKMWVCKCEICV